MERQEFNVLLMVPPGGYFAERWRESRGMPELGILYLAAVLERAKYNISVLPCNLYDDSWDVIRLKMREKGPHIVGVTVTTENRFQSFEVLRQAKMAVPDAVTLIGGPHVTNTAQDTLEHLDFIDAVVRGEGEETLLEICESLRTGGSFEGIRGVSFRNSNGLIIHNQSRQPIEDLDELPFPARHLVDHDRYNFRVDVPGVGLLPAANIMTSRGCPFNCNFCATPANWGRHVRTISPSRVIEEMKLVVKNYGVKVIWFYDDTFNINQKRVEELCRLIIAEHLEIFWFCEVRIDVLSKELLSIMKEAGCFHIGFGVEAGSERVRREIVRKNFDTDQARRVVQWCNELDIIANPFFVVSHPTETPAELEETLRIMKEFEGKSQQSVSILHIYPGTDLEQVAREKKLLPEDFTWTKRHDSRIITLPAAQGDVPLFLDRLNWWHIGRILFQWSSSQGYSVGNKIPAVLRNIRSYKDIFRYGILFICFLRYRFLPKHFSRFLG